MLNKRAINVIIKHIALLVKKSSVDVGLDSKQLFKTICYFPIQTRHTDAVGLTVQITIFLQKFCIAVHGNKHVMSTCSANSNVQFALLKVVKLYLLIYYRVLE